ncbi:MAG: tRNA (adenosine(37)-N6)-dimethylallyltransferase MiaA [Oscillospiraceae bacterium]|nr:tRNA (adenosine(37)-N6)-dimethylallyltransferase MiaA [Oscillospiraceae bacterium]
MNSKQNKPHITVIAGPTATGKTALAAELALHINGEVISADSMQVYSNMPIGTAAPTQAEKRGVPHYLLEFLPPNEEYSLARFLEDANAAIQDILARGKSPIICGGTGLYISSLIDNIKLLDCGRDEALRRTLEAKAEQEGLGSLLSELAVFDPESAEELSKTRNLSRIIRAIELYRLSGISISEQKRLSRAVPSPYQFKCIALNFKDRSTLYTRINSRIDKMLEAGLLEEARRILAVNESGTSAQAIGHKELAAYLHGLCTFDEAVERLKMETRRFAKRQITWFKRDSRFSWFFGEDYSCVDELVEAIAF